MDKTNTGPKTQTVAPPSIITITPEQPPVSGSGLEDKEAHTLEDNGASKVQKEVHAIAVRALRFGAIVLGIIVLVRVWHVIGFNGCRWLSEPDIQSIDKMLFSSAFGGLVLGYLKEIMKPLPKK